MNNFSLYALTTFLVLAFCLWGVSLNAQTFFGGTGAVIDETGDGPCGSNQFTASVSGIGEGTLDAVNLDITHTFTADLDIGLISPAGTYIDLSSDNGNSGDDYTGTEFSDTGVDGDITLGTAPFTGSFIPEQPLSTFTGECMNGNWILEACDDAAGDVGTVNSWSVTFTAGAACAGGTCSGTSFSGATGSLTDATGNGPCGTNQFTASVSGIGQTGATLNCVNLDITHTFASDLDIGLISPAGTYIDLSSDNGGSGDNYTNTEFSDTGMNGDISLGTAPFTGSFIPEEPLSTFTGECMNGDWKLEACDDGSGNTGTLNSWSITFTPGTSCPLPVDLISFNGETVKGSNILMWETASEENTKWHVAERSLNGRDNWEEVGRVEAMGFADYATSYQLKDEKPLVKGYYRLKSLDFDGKMNFSDIILLERKVEQFEVLNIAPNPARSTMNVAFQTPETGLYTIRISNLAGQTMYVEQLNLQGGVHNQDINLTNFANGVYLIFIENAYESVVHKLVKQ